MQVRAIAIATTGERAAEAERTWASGLLGLEDAPPGLAIEARRLGASLALSSTFGCALGMRDGARAMALEALAIPCAWVAVALLGVPALAILQALVDAPLRAAELLRAATRAAARGGVVLAGLAAPMALLSTTTETAGATVAFGALGLGIAWAIALRGFSRAIAAQAATPRARLATLGFALFSTTLAGRIWLAALAPLWGSP